MIQASVMEQHASEGVSQKQKVGVHSRHKLYGGDQFFSKAAEPYPVENNLALTSSFIYGGKGSGKSVKIGSFEIDVLWLYILGALIVIGIVVGAVICCCSGEDPNKKGEEANKMEEKGEMMNNDNEMGGEEPKPEEGMNMGEEGEKMD